MGNAIFAIKRIRLIVAFFVLGMFFFAWSGCGEHTPPKHSMEAQARAGKLLFEEHCQGCHGEDGKGKEIQDAAATSADLTKIMARRNVKEFPTMEIARFIDGRTMIEAHGEKTMPAWGEVFASGENMDQKEIEGTMAEIIAYLVSIQEPNYE
ncbi:MAG: cytochrome c [Saprospiraceae bacterium]